MLASFAIILMRKRELAALLLLPFGGLAKALPRGDVCWSVVCDCGIS